MTKTREELVEYARKRAEERAEDETVFAADCEVIIYFLDHCEITVIQENRFFVDAKYAEISREALSRPRAHQIKKKFANDGLSDGVQALAYTGIRDFGHTSPHWESVIPLGIFGLRKRISDYAETYATDARKQSFYHHLEAVYDAALRFMERAAGVAEAAGKQEMADGLHALVTRPPQSLFEVMQTSIVYYYLQHFFDGTPIRTMGRLDSLFYPYFIKEDRERAEELISDFLREIDRWHARANIPFSLCGTDSEGNDLTNELSYLFVEKYSEAKLPDTKIHVFCSKKTPDGILKACLDAVRNGGNSFVFLSDERVIESLLKLGADPKDASNYHIVGCYEAAAEQEVPCSCNARVNIPKALEVTLSGGVDLLTGKQIGLPIPCDPASFDDLWELFVRQLNYFCDNAVLLTDRIEEHYSKIHASPIFSATLPHALEEGRDVYCESGAKYCNSSLNAVGLATAADSLFAIKKLVFEDGTLTLDELKTLLINNWQGKEPLRLTIKNKFPKYGNGDERVDRVAQRITDALAERVNGRPNKKGGVWRLGLFSIHWRWEFGEKCAASADGRLSGETLSQNASASFGADRLGATAHLRSVASLDSSNTPNATIADIDLHESATVGENGMRAMLSTLRAYFALGGFSVHYNVLNTQKLIDAMEHPERYPNLQVRLCGWNVLFSSLSEKEQREFITRSIRE